MITRFGDRLRQLSTSTGTGNITLGAAPTGFVALAAEYAANEDFAYGIEGLDGAGALTGQWEVGIGHLDGSGHLVRATVSKSSSGGAHVNFSAVSLRVFVTISAEGLDNYVDTRSTPLTRTMAAGAGLTGGGDLSADRTFDVVANADGSIVVNTDDIQVGVLANDAQHGSRGGGSQHAAATGSVAGFMAAADKSKLDGLPSSAVPSTRTVTAGSGLTGGGPLSTDISLHVGPGTDGSIDVFADEVRVGVLATDVQHGVRGGASLHALATSLVAGFMAAADKSKLDGLPSTAPPTSRTLTAGAGLTGGGDLSADRTFNVVANGDGSIIVNADDIQVGILASDVQHGSRGGGSQHAAFTATVNGFVPAPGTASGTKFLRDDGTWATVGGGGVSAMGAFGSTPNANGATITGSTLVLQPSDATHPGGISLANQTLGAGTKTVDALNATAGVQADIGFTPIQIGGQVGGVHRLEAYGTAPFPFRLLTSTNGFGGLHLAGIKVVGAIATASIYNNEQSGYIGQNNGQLVMYSQGVGGPTSAGTFVWRSQNAYTNGSSDVLSSDTSHNVTVGYKLIVQGTSNDGTTPQFCVRADPAWNNARASISPLLTNNSIIPNMQTGQLWSLLDIYFDRASPNGVPLGGTMLSLGTTTTSTALQVGQIAFYNINGRTVNSDDMRIAYIEGVTSGAKDKGALNFVTANGANALALAVSILPTGATQFVGNITKINNVVTNWPSTQGAASTVLTNDGAGNFSWAAGGGGGSGVTTVGAFGSTPTANAATITGTSIFLQPADATHPGSVAASGAQAFGVAPNFSGAVTTTGSLAAHFASSTSIDNVAGLGRIFVDGPNNTTNGTFRLSSNRSDGSNALNLLDFSVTGGATFLNTLTLNSKTYTFPAAFVAGGALTDIAGNGTLTWVVPSGGGGGVTTMAAIGAVPNANGASISGSTLTLQPASASFGGVVTTSAQTLGAGTKQVDALNVGGTMGVGNVGGVVRFDDGGTNGYTFRTLNASNGFGSMSVGAIKFNGAVTTAAIYNNEQMGYVGQNNGQLVMYSQGVGFGAGTHVWRSQNGYTNGSADVLISDTALNVKVGYKLTVQGTSNDGSTVQFSVLADPSWNNARAAISPLTANNTIIPNMQTGQTWSLLDIYNNRAQPNGTPVGGTMLSLGTTTTSTSLQVGQVAFYNINGRTVNSDDMRIAYIEGATSGAKDKGEINIYTANGVNTLAKAVSISPTKNSLFFGDVAAMNAANGLVLKDTQGTPHYWRITVTTLGVLTVTDIGTTYP